MREEDYEAPGVDVLYGVGGDDTRSSGFFSRGEISHAIGVYCASSNLGHE